ncbi:F-box only protein 41-like [Silurus asotus]|uniref:F-box only protein 41-like n=1 Tax=Silurus asotus TaxID=30991 RepID=A0AAD5A3P9_SILAS|nr:F-box only protein 41-like [Silurus asotus]
MSTAAEQPKHCPDCGELCGFGDVPKKHTCQMICLTPRRKSEGALMALSTQTQSSSSMGNIELSQPSHLELLDALSLAPSATSPLAHLLVHQCSPTLLSSTAPFSLSPFSRPEQALAQMSTPWQARLAMEAGLQQLTLEVQEHVSIRLGSLQDEVRRRNTEVHRARRESERMEKEKQNAEEKAAELERQVDVSVEMLASLRKELMEREEELSLKQQEVCDLDRFVQETALKEASAKLRLQSFIENLLERAERAERQLQELHTPSRITSPDGSFTAAGGALHQRCYSESAISRCCYSQCDHTGSPVHRSEMCEVLCEVQCYQKNPSDMEADSDSWSVYSTESLEGLKQHYRIYNKRVEKKVKVGHIFETKFYYIKSNTLQHCIQTIHTHTYTHPHTLYFRKALTLEIPYRIVIVVLHENVSVSVSKSVFFPAVLSCTENPVFRHHSRHRGNRPDRSAMCLMQVKRRAWLFCVFPYLDTHSLLTAAQVCKDWWSVAHHPAMWSRVTLENNRISSKFMVTMAQWCSETHTLILHNLKPRSRAKKESKEEYLKNTRGCLEAGLEAVLRAAGRSLVALTVSHCTNILTDRTLWLVSCHCRALQTLTYRSSSDPVGQEVIWALGAGCRDITSLKIAPLQPCQQPSRFSNRCLQTIGRCWPRLYQVGVGGAGCGLQGLTSLVRNCPGVCVLELDHMSELSQQGAAELCREGLQQIHTLIFNYTPVTAKAILHFHSVCLRLKCIIVTMSSADFFDDHESQETRRIFYEMVTSLQALKKRPGLSDILHVRVDQGDNLLGS